MTTQDNSTGAARPDNTATSEATPWTDAEQQPFIELQAVTKRFGNFTAVHNISLKIYRGELFAILGGSGCGKGSARSGF